MVRTTELLTGKQLRHLWRCEMGHRAASGQRTEPLKAWASKACPGDYVAWMIRKRASR